MPQPLPLTELTELPAPYLKGPIEIDSQWIDHNGHLNMAYYNVIFDQSADRLYAAVGLGKRDTFIDLDDRNSNRAKPNG